MEEQAAHHAVAPVSHLSHCWAALLPLEEAEVLGAIAALAAAASVVRSRP
jgi:hypothetical protein